jgi:hypothetical protein
MTQITQEDFNEVYIVGFRLNYENETPELYTIIIYEETEKAITHNGNLLFVTDLSKVKLIYSFLDSGTKEKFEIPTHMKIGIDVAKTLYLLENEKEDDSATILDCLNIILDLFKSIEVIIPEDKKKILYGLADFLTFADDFPTYLEKSSISRETIIDVIIWCLGKLLTRSRIQPDAEIEVQSEAIGKL